MYSKLSIIKIVFRLKIKTMVNYYKKTFVVETTNKQKYTSVKEIIIHLNYYTN